MTYYRHKHKFWGRAKGSRKFPYRETLIDPHLFSFNQAQQEHEALLVRRTKTLRSVVREMKRLGIKSKEDIVSSVREKKKTIEEIDARLAYLIEEYPGVEW